jgi:methylated-DNA-[protein]-cysteine S-methyltransferase
MSHVADDAPAPTATLGVALVPSRGIARAPQGAGGHTAVAFGPEGLLGVLLPGDDDLATLAALREVVAARRPDLPPLQHATPAGAAAEDVAILAEHLATGDAPLATIRLDVRGMSDFRVRIGDAARSIPAGCVRTYGELAREVGSVARAVGRAMATNPFAVVVPCHRVVAANGGPGGFSAPGGLATKDALLRLEGRARGLDAPAEQPQLFGDQRVGLTRRSG